jgi:hypothetical protein
MRSQNDVNADYVTKAPQMRNLKRDLKKELKQAELKIRHQIKYCVVPSTVLDEAKVRYNPGMTTRDVRSMHRNKYEKCPWIAKIVPTKRVLP